MKKRELLLVGSICIAVGCISCLTTVGFYEKKKTEAPYEAQGAVIDSVSVSAGEEKITPSTKMVYQYYYTEDGVTQETAEVPPYFLLDMTLEDLRKTYQDWQIQSFSAKEVVMRKSVAGKSDEQYIIGEKDGYVAVFYEEAKHGILLHEITDTPLSSLPMEERQRLVEGISVTGDENLAKILSDYTS